MSTTKKEPVKFVESVSEFVELMTSLSDNGQAPTAFRGQKYFGWSSIPKVFRPEVNLLNSEDLAVRDIVSVHPHEFDSDKTMFDRLVRMQHYGLPTRLLDVTINPLVALFFASDEYRNEHGEPMAGSVTSYIIPKARQRYYDSDRVSCMANLANLKIKTKKEIFALAEKKPSIEDFNNESCADELLYNIRMEKPHFRPIINPLDLIKPVYVKPKMNNKRIIAQSGAFLLYGALNVRGRKSETLMRVHRLSVPHEAKSDIKKQLQLLGIHSSTLFPEIDKTAEFITSRYQGMARDNDDSLL